MEWASRLGAFDRLVVRVQGVVRVTAQMEPGRRSPPGSRRGTAAVLAACIAAGLAAAGPVAASPPGAIAEYSAGLPAPGVPAGIAAAVDGNLWVTNQGRPPNESMSAKVIARVTPAGGITAPAPVTGPASAITPGPDGNLWFTVVGRPAAIGRLTSAGAIVPGFFSPNAGGDVGGLVTGPDGNVWLAVGQYVTSPGAIVRVTPQGAITEFPTDGIAGWNTPADVAAGPDGNLWFAVRRNDTPRDGFPSGTPGAVGRVTPAGAFTILSGGLNAGSDPRAIAAGADGNLWFTDRGATAAIGRISPAGAVTEFSAGLNAGSAPRDIALGADGNLWFTDEGATPAIGRISPDGTIAEFTSGLGAGSAPASIAAGPDGNLWFTDQGARPAVGTAGSGAPAANASPPLVRGAPLVGSRLSCEGDTWSSWAGAQPLRDRFGFDGHRWRRDGALLPGASATTYRPVAADAGHQIACEVTVTYPLIDVSATAASPPVTVRSAPLGVRIAGARTVTRGGRARLRYRITNRTGRALRGVVLTNLLPKGLRIDAASLRANAAVRRRSLRFAGRGRRVTFTIGTLARRASAVVNVDAAVARATPRGRRANSVVVRATGVAPLRAESSVTIR